MNIFNSNYGMQLALKQVFDRTGLQQYLGQQIGVGGEATIYAVPDKPNAVVKLYHDSVLAKRGKNLEAKIEAMRNLGAQLGVMQSQSCSWPLINLFDAQGNWIGYVMHKVEGVKMCLLAHAIAYRKHFPHLNRIKIVEYLIDFLKEIKKFHANNIMIGDYNLQNILLDPRSSKVTLIDCDSYQISYQNQFFPCEVGSADMTPSEHHNKAFKDVVRTVDSENFSVAIILFKALMLGRHPYDVVGGDDPVNNLRRGFFPYAGGTKNSIPTGAWFNIWSHMPFKLKSLFIQTFTEGARNPKKRATINEWLNALEIYRSEMAKNWHTVEISPRNPKNNNYKGTRDIS